MGYVEQNLLPNETIIYRAKLHWIIFRWVIFWSWLFLIVLSAGKEGSDAIPGCTVLLAISVILAFLNYKTSEFALTDRRLVMKTGIIRRNSIEILLPKIEGIRVHQGVLGRILGYGTLVVSGTGGMWQPFKKIARPLEFRKRIQDQLSLARDEKISSAPAKAKLCVHCGKYYDGNPSYCPNCGKSLR